MNPVEFDKNESYFENLQTITNFFKRYKSVGFLFAVANFRQVVNDVNLNVINESKNVNKTINIIELEWNGQKGIITQLEFFLKENPSNGLIINNIDELIEESKGEIIYSLNYAREGLIALNIPILFWLNDENHARFSLEAIDLYLRRDFSTVFFEDIDLSQKHLLLNSVFSDKYQTTEDYQNTRIRIELLEKQLHEAEEKGYPPKKIAREIVVDLITEYQDVSLFKEAHELVKKYDNYFDWENSTVLSSIGMLYKSLDRFSEAILILEKALRIDVEELGENNSVIINRQTNLGGVLIMVWEFEKAKTVLDKALQNCVSLFGNNDFRIPIILTKLANIYRLTKDFEKAKNFSTEALNITVKLFGKHDINTISYYANLSGVYSDSGNFKKALELQKRGLQIFRENYTEKHPNLISLLSNLATIYMNLDDFTTAKKILEESIKLEIELFGDNHPTLGIRYNNLSFTIEKTGNLGTALYYAQKSYNLILKAYDKQHPQVKSIFQHLQHLQALQQKSLTQSEA